MDKKSGVYYYLTDQSLRQTGSSTFGGVVLMYTTKGEVGKLITVTANDYRDRLGYDLNYNPNYAGLDLMLSSVARLDVLRLNLEASVANLYWGDSGGVSSVADIETFEAIQFSAPNAEVWVAHKSPGSWGDRCVVFQRGNADRKEYTLHYFAHSNGVFSILRRSVFSLDPKEADFYKNVNFGDLVLGFADEEAPAFPASISADFMLPANVSVVVKDTNLLRSGSNGLDFNSEAVFTVDDISTRLAVLESSPANVLVMNGFIGGLGVDQFALCKAIITYNANHDRSVFIDAEHIMSADTDVLDAPSIVERARDLLSEDGQFGQLTAVPDQVDTRSGSILIQPSVFLFQIYARMFERYGHVNFPPAGPTYGTVSASKLVPSNFHLYGNELKTARVNYLTSTSSGVCVWEQRTLYNIGGSDLSNASTVFILRDLKQRLLAFMENFTFRFAAPIDLLSMQSGLTRILDEFVNNGFLFSYSLKVPTYEEAQESTECDIDIGVNVTKDMQVLNLRVAVQSSNNS